MKKPLQWHPAFQAVLQIEFAEEAKYLQFLKEYNLTDSPLRIDTLIIKVDAGVKIQKRSGESFADTTSLSIIGTHRWIWGEIKCWKRLLNSRIYI